MADTIEKAVHEAISKAAKDVQETVIQQAVKDFEVLLRKQIGEIAITLANYYSIERLGHDLIIRAQLEKK